MKQPEAITSFRGPYRFLSNFWPAAVAFGGEIYPTVEHAYQAAKTLDKYSRHEIRIARTPGEAKRLGKKVRIRPNWEECKIAIMGDLLRQKFQDSQLGQSLRDTGQQELIEGNQWGDRFWGQCPIGNGENRLGKLLMKIREELRKK